MSEQTAPPATDTVSFTIDGKPATAKKGEMLIAAAEKAGVYIPRFCYHPRLRPVGMCRMCIVEVEGPRGPALVPSCFVPVNEGNVVITDSPRVKKAQDGVLEFLLINHPLDCPVCDKGGECPLQDNTLNFGPGETRFVEEKRHWEKPINLSDLVLLDRERCIQCDRCTRFADEVAGDPLIEFIGRGGRTEINTFPDQPFSSYFSGNTVQICPVGALTAAPYRFKARPWDLEQVESTCTSCAVGCRVAVQSSSDRITRLIGLDSDPVNHGWLCDKGRFDYEAVNSEDRLTVPMVRSGGGLAEVGWGEALDAAAKALTGALALHGGTNIGVIGGARLANEDAYAWAKLAKGVLGTDSVDCQLGDGLPAEAVLGLPRTTIDDACNAGAVILLAPDIKEELPVLYLRLRAAALKGLKIVELVPKGTGLSKYAAATLGYRPGEAHLVARALAGGAAAGGGEVAGVSAAAIDEARAILSGAGDKGVVVVLGRPSLAEPAESVVAAAQALNDGLPVFGFLSALRRGNVHGALDMGLAPGILPGRVALDAGREHFAAAWPQVPEERGRDTRAILEAAADGKLAVLVLLGADPISDFPDRDLATRALQGAGTVIAVDSFLNPSSERANVVLPAAMWGERPGTTTNIEGRITRLGQKITAPGLAWPDWMIAGELAARLNRDLGFSDLAGIWAEIEQVSAVHAGITAAVLGERRNRDGVLAPLGEPSGSDDDTDHLADPTAEPATAAADAQGETITPVAEPQESAADAPAAEAEADADDAGEVSTGSRPDVLSLSAPVEPPTLPRLDGYAMRLVTSRTLYDTGTLNVRSPSLARLAREACVRLHPQELERIGVPGGGSVRVHSSKGSLVLEGIADPAVPRGSVWMPWNATGDGVAALFDGSQPVTDVRVESAGSAS